MLINNDCFYRWYVGVICKQASVNLGKEGRICCLWESKLVMLHRIGEVSHLRAVGTTVLHVSVKELLLLLPQKGQP